MIFTAPGLSDAVHLGGETLLQSESRFRTNILTICGGAVSGGPIIKEQDILLVRSRGLSDIQTQIHVIISDSGPNFGRLFRFDPTFRAAR